MKIAFIQEEVRTRQGIMILSAILKKQGHTTEVFSSDEGVDKVLDDIRSFNPQVAAFSTGTSVQRRALELASLIRKRQKDIFIMMGGPHPTFYPKVIEDSDILDAICLGEGEGALLELADKLSKSQKIENIENLWIKTGRGIKKNNLRPFIDDLDALPDPDHDQTHCL